ncbi:MAG: ParA family protein [Acaryochloris sp. CRU_2_0]|nr:ParA family protein [Acaryochloris sp. CRU_2_0]
MSNSGGVGKTTLTVNLAFQLARKNNTILMLGCDPNGSLTLFSGLDDPPPEKRWMQFYSPTLMASTLSFLFGGIG